MKKITIKEDENGYVIAYYNNNSNIGVSLLGEDLESLLQDLADFLSDNKRRVMLQPIGFHDVSEYYQE